jgi:hypothetical protein
MHLTYHQRISLEARRAWELEQGELVRREQRRKAKRAEMQPQYTALMDEMHASIKEHGLCSEVVDEIKKRFDALEAIWKNTP